MQCANRALCTKQESHALCAGDATCRKRKDRISLTMNSELLEAALSLSNCKSRLHDETLEQGKQTRLIVHKVHEILVLCIVNGSHTASL